MWLMLLVVVLLLLSTAAQLPHVMNSLLTQSLRSSTQNSKPAQLLWGPPTKDQDVVSSSGDYRWVYPDLSHSDYIASRYFAHEQNQVLNMEPGLACHLGASADGGGFVGQNKCQFPKMDFMADFKPVGPPRALFSLVDFLLLWRTNHAAATNSTIMFVGDSVTGQVFMAALCEARRNHHTLTITNTLPSNTPPIASTIYKYDLFFFEATLTLKSDPTFVYTLVYCRQYMYTSNLRIVQAYLYPADVLILGWGLHYYHQNGVTIARPTIFEPIFRLLNQTDKIQDLFWMGPSKLAFRYDANNADTLGHWTGDRAFCGPTFVHPTIAHHTINRDVEFTLQSMNLSYSWFSWKEKKKGAEATTTARAKFHMTILPFEELTSPFFRNYPAYNNDTSVKVLDCAHNCWLPNLYEPLWDALYLGLSRRYSGRSPTLFPTAAGKGNPHPQVKSHSGPFLSDLIRNSIWNETSFGSNSIF